MDRTRSPAIPPLVDEDHDCAECGVSYAALTPAAAVTMIRSVPDEVRGAVGDASRELLCTRPAPGNWSMLEYVCHLRDVYEVATIRLHRARTEDGPVLEPMLNDLRARRFRYNERELAPVLDELDAAVSGCVEEIERIGPGGYDRYVTRLPGERRSTLWLVRQAAHEGRHHCADIERVLRSAATRSEG